MVKFNPQIAQDLIDKSLSAAASNVKLDLNDSNEIYELVFAIFGVAAGLIPVVGSSFSSLINLIGAVIFPKQTPDIWPQLRKPIEKLIGIQIEAYHVKTLQDRVEGLQANYEAFQSVVNDFDNEAEGPDKERQADILRDHHIAFLSVVRSAMPDFQLDDYAIAALPSFALAANVHLTLLVDGINRGLDWGYTDDFINHTLRPEFKEKVGTLNAARDLQNVMPRDSSQDTQLDMLRKAIKHGEELGWSQKLLDTWRAALSELASGPSIPTRSSKLDYPAHAKEYYNQGREKVRGYDAELPEYENNGITAADKLRAFADYDYSMIMSVLTYAEYWPYLLGDIEVPLSVQDNLDREIFAGPFGRYTTHATWSEGSPPPVKPREDKINSIRVRAYDDVDGLQVKYGSIWGDYFGSSTGGTEHVYDLTADDIIEAIDVHYGHKLGGLAFHTNETVFGPVGNSRHAQFTATVNYTGYALTSAYITNWSGHAPTGCEGIIFGLRPLIGSL